VVTPGTAGTPGTVAYKNASTADPNSALAQNVVYGKIPQDNALAAGQPAGTYPLFEWVNGINTGAGINGYNDWYVPAKNETEIIYYNLKPNPPTGLNANDTSTGINPNAVPARASNYTAGGPPNQTVSAIFQSTNNEAFSTLTTYWSSTEVSGGTTSAWVQIFNNGTLFQGAKGLTPYSARVIRRIPIAEYTAAGSPAIGS
jgi:hypothetical protein